MYTEQRRPLRRNDLVYPELSYQIVGVLFTVWNTLGPGYHEKYYQRAVAEHLRVAGLKFEEQKRVPLLAAGKIIGWYQLDFLIDGIVVLELKAGDKFSPQNIQQMTAYLRATSKKLALLANFTKSGLQFKRVVNVGDS